MDWLARNNLHVDFEGYPEKPKEDLLSVVRKLHQMHTTIRSLLKDTLKAEDFALIDN